MRHYIYHFSDGTKNTIEVTDEMYKTLRELDAQERRNNRRETRRHVPLLTLVEINSDVLALDEDLSDVLIAKEDMATLQAAIESLTEEEQDIVQLYYLG